MKITQKSIIEDIKKAVGTSDIIPDSCYGEDYFSYRYKWNTERPFVLIRAYGESQLNVIVGKSEYTIRDDETYEALKPLIAKKVKSEFKSIRSEIVFQDKEMAVILHFVLQDEKGPQARVFFFTWQFRRREPRCRPV